MLIDFLEIGTSDFGSEIERATDSTHGISIEPIAYYLDRLPNRNNCRKINSAISDHDGQMTIYYVPPTKIKKLNLPNWVRGCNSVGKQHVTVVNLLKERHLEPDEIIESHQVDVMSFETLVTKYNISALRYLKVDTEGHDVTILNSYFDFCDHDANLLAQKINFETNELSSRCDIDNVINRAKSYGYFIASEGVNTVLVKEEKQDVLDILQPVAPPVTCVLLNWKRLENVKLIVSKLKKKDYFSEILIWNNNPETISLADFSETEGATKLTIINSDENLKDEAKYRAAASAKNDHIFYQDDDWMSVSYIDGMYRAYCLNSFYIHLAVGELGYGESYFSNYYNPQLGYQSEFNFIGLGAFFNKSYAVDYLKFIEDNFTSEEAAYADFGFTLLNNQPSIRIQARLAALNQDNAFSSETNFLLEAKSLKKRIVLDLLKKVSQPIKALPKILPRSAYMSYVLFTSYLPSEFDKYNDIFDPLDEDGYERRNLNRPSQGVTNKFRHNCYYDALSNEADKYWITLMHHGDIWGIWVLKKCQIKLNLKYINAAIDPNKHEWLLTVDGYNLTLSLKEIAEMTLQVNKEVKLTCMTKSAELAVKVKPQ